MKNVTAALPRKTMQPWECKLLSMGGDALTDELGGAAAMACLLDIVASWHSFRHDLPFHVYAQRWLSEGNAKSSVADRLLKDMFGLNDPDPRKSA